MATNSTGNCYLCGDTLAKSAMKNHIIKLHGDDKDGQDCCLLKIEGVDFKDYWLYIDIPKKETLMEVDSFLRQIWLECCGHMSSFFYPKYNEIEMDRKWGSFATGDKLLHHYDFGTTTETLVTIMGSTVRKTPKGGVRLLARNVPLDLKCVDCGKPAEYVGMGSFDPHESLYCANCCDKNGEEGEFLPVSNSPRMGQCGYSGENDCFAFDPASVAKK